MILVIDDDLRYTKEIIEKLPVEIETIIFLPGEMGELQAECIKQLLDSEYGWAKGRVITTIEGIVAKVTELNRSVILVDHSFGDDAITGKDVVTAIREALYKGKIIGNSSLSHLQNYCDGVGCGKIPPHVLA